MQQGPPPPDRPDPERPAGPPPGPQAPGPAAPPPPGAHPQAPPGGWEQPIPSPGAVPARPGQPLASWGIRVAATLLDLLILLVPSLLLIFLVLGVLASGSEIGAIVTGIISFLAYVMVGLLYGPVLVARSGDHNGQTWGKQIVGCRVVRDNGQQIELGFGFLREFAVKNLLFGFVGGFFFSIPTIIDWLWPLWDDQNRCLHDMIVSTHVVRSR